MTQSGHYILSQQPEERVPLLKKKKKKDIQPAPGVHPGLLLPSVPPLTHANKIALGKTVFPLTSHPPQSGLAEPRAPGMLTIFAVWGPKAISSPQWASSLGSFRHTPEGSDGDAVGIWVAQSAHFTFTRYEKGLYPWNIHPTFGPLKKQIFLGTITPKYLPESKRSAIRFTSVQFHFMYIQVYLKRTMYKMRCLVCHFFEAWGTWGLRLFLS